MIREDIPKAITTSFLQNIEIEAWLTKTSLIMSGRFNKSEAIVSGLSHYFENLKTGNANFIQIMEHQNKIGLLYRFRLRHLHLPVIVRSRTSQSKGSK
jgi:hypothetical protein